MKQLVNFFRSNRNNRSSALARRKSTSRFLAPETLEKRQLLAGDLLPAHNYAIAEDVNRDYKVTPLDALLVINQISRNGGSQNLTGMSRGALDKYFDVSADNNITPLDALRVINRLAKPEAAGELVELRVNPRTLDDNDFGADFNAATRNLTVDVNEIFNLEIQYNDLRNRFGGDVGVFALYTNILTNEADTLEPVLTETQTVGFTGNLASVTTGDLRFSLPGNTTTVTVPFGDFFSNPTGSLTTVLTTLGYQANQFRVTAIPSTDEPGSTTLTREYLIRYTDLTEFADEDLPNLVVTPVNVRNAGGTEVPIGQTVAAIPPRIGNNAINPAAIALNIDFRSRTYGNNLPFFGKVGDATGGFDTATGFTGIGASGELVDGVPSAGQGPLIEPFDAFSVPVRVVKATSSLQVTLGPTGQTETQTLIYGAEDPVPDDLLLFNTTNDPSVATDGFALLNITAVSGSVSVTAANSTLNFTEDGAQQSLNLSSLVTVNGSTATPTFAITTQPARGTLTLNGSTATYLPAADDFTTTPSNLSFVYTATVAGTTGRGTVTINIAAVNDAPVAVADAAVSATTATATTIAGSTLTSNDSPGPGETGTVTIASVNAASAQGGTVTLTGQNIVYRSANGFTGADTITYTISDGSRTTQTTLTVNVSAAPVVTIAANNGNLSFNEDEAAKTLNLSTLTTVTGSTTTPTFTITTQPARGTASISGTTLTYTPAADDFTTTGAPITLVYRAAIGSVNDSGTITIAIASVNDAPTFVADTARTTPINTPVTIAVSSLLANDSPGPANEGQTVSVATTPVPSATNGTVALNGGNFVFTPTTGFTGAAVISYTITDGTATRAATLTVNVTPAAVVTVTANNSSLSYAEDGAAKTLNLSTLTTVTGSTATPTFAISTQPARGTATISGSTITYTPAANDFTTSGSPLLLVYTASVGSVSDTGTVTITISSVNDAPTFVADTARSTTANTPLTVAISSLLANDSPGPANEGQTVALATTPVPTATNGTVAVNGGNFVFTPTTGFTGAATINYSITDGVATTAANLTVNVTAAGTVTVAAGNSTLSMNEDAAPSTLNLTTLTTVTNSTATPTFTIVTQPARGTLTLSGTTVTYRPQANDFTTTPLTFVYRAAVGNANDTGTVTINIAAVNDAPVATTDGVFVRTNTATTFPLSTFTGNDSAGPANEGQTVTLTAVNAITGNNATRGTVALVGGNVVYTPPTDYEGADQFSYTISDGVTTAVGTVNVTVGQFVPKTITGNVFIDFLSTGQTRNGIKESFEPVAARLQVRLTNPGGTIALSTGPVASLLATTDLQGQYSFANIPPGVYQVELVLPSDGSVTVVTESIVRGTVTVPTAGAATTVQGPSLSIAAMTTYEVIDGEQLAQVGSEFLVYAYVPRSIREAAAANATAAEGEADDYRSAVDQIYGNGSLF